MGSLRYTILLLMILGFATMATADDRVTLLRPFPQNDRLCVELQAADLLNERTASTIDSGLPGSCVYHIQIVDSDDHTLAERIIDLTLRLDLWENVYLLDDPAGTTTLTSLAAADSAWSHLPGVDLCALSRLEPGEDYRLQARVFVQPLAPEMRVRLTRYVSSSSGRTRDELAIDLSAVIGQMIGRSGDEKVESWSIGSVFRRRELESQP